MAALQDQQVTHLAKVAPRRPSLGATAPQLAPLRPRFAEAVPLMLPKAVWAGSPPNILCKPPQEQYKRRGEPPLSTHTRFEPLSLHLYSFPIFSSVVGARRSYFGELGQLESFGMNNIKSFLLYLLSYYQYSSAYEIELCSYVISLAYRTSCLIFHTTLSAQKCVGTRQAGKIYLG